MDIYYWIGVTSTVWNVNTNWERSGGGGTYPGTGDAAGFIKPDCPYYPAGGDKQIDLAEFWVANTFNGNIASSGTPLQLGAGKVIIDAENANGIYLKGGSAGGGLGTVRMDVIYILDTAIGKEIVLDAKVGKVYLIKANVEFKSTIVFGGTSPLLDIGYLTDTLRDVTLKINYGATLPSAIECRGGTIENYAAISAIDFLNGEMTHGKDTEDNCGDLATPSLRGGKIFWNKGNITTLELLGGTVDGSDGKTDRQIMNCEGFDGACLDINNGVGNIGVCNPIVVHGSTFQLIVSPGTELSVNSCVCPTTTAAPTTTV